MLKVVLIVAAIGIILWLVVGLVIRSGSKESSALGHETPPTKASEPSFDAEDLIGQVKGSDYFANLQPLKKFVDGKTVVRSETGNAGFILYLDNATWVATFREKDKVGHAMGSGEVDDTVRSAISSTEYGDASNPISADRLYAGQPCDIPVEVGKSHGQMLSGLAIGIGAFNFSFTDRHELDVSLVEDEKGRPAFRVFWEQW